MQWVQNVTLAHMRTMLDDVSAVPRPLILFQHIPLYKPVNTCVDAPTIIYDRYAEGTAQHSTAQHSTAHYGARGVHIVTCG
jgi:hypothetical protein